MILLLNGTSSSGKSTLAKYLLKAFDEPFIFHSFDSLVPSLLPHPDSFQPMPDKQPRCYVRKLDKELYNKLNEQDLRIIEACYRCIPVFADSGFNIIVESVFWDEVLRFFTGLLSGYSDVYFIGVHCPPEELERREGERKDRKKGNAVNQYFKLHVGKSYDIEVNTYGMSYDECADPIVSYVHNNKPFAFYTNRVDE